MKIITGHFREAFFTGVLDWNKVTGKPPIRMSPRDMRWTFSGAVAPGEGIFGASDGILIDQHGFSNITNWKETRSCITFTKRYEHRSDFTVYSFHRYENRWYGEWSGNLAKKGIARLSIIDEDPEYFDPKRTLEVLETLRAAQSVS